MRKKSLAETSPKLAAEIHPDSDIKANEVTAGSNKKPLWVCKLGHTWRSKVSHRSNGSGCPYCSGRVAIFGVNDLATVNPKLATQVHPDSDTKATEVTALSGKKVLWMCKLGHTWRAKVSERSKGSGCPYCSGRKPILGINDLATTNPYLAAQIHPDSDIKAEEVTAGSNKKPLWVCELGHTWRVAVASRNNGTDCPYCSGNKVLPGFNDLATVSPSLASEVSPKSKIKATEVTAGSNKKLLWKCGIDHQWTATVAARSDRGADCPYCCNRRVLEGFNDLATTNPWLAAQIHMNSGVKANELTVGSDKKPLWVCELGHTWKTTPEKRLQGRGCPYCTGRKILPGFNDLATVNPELATQVHPDSDTKANEIMAGSGRKLLWLCKRGHTWRGAVASRNNGAGCPYCSGHRVLPGFNDLATVNPELAAQVHPDSDTKANEIMAGSGRKLLWLCDRNHRWKASVISRKNGNNCPYCSGREPVVGKTDLATVNPKLAREISPNSKIKATEVTASSGKKLLWHCRLGHEWLSSVDNRLRGCGCPQCAGSQAERDLSELVKSLLPEHMKILRNDRKVIKPYELDILVPSLDLAFEFNGTYWHSDEMIKKRNPLFESSKAFDDFKKAECAKRGINLFFVREKPWTENHDKEVNRVEKIVAAALKKTA